MTLTIPPPATGTRGPLFRVYEGAASGIRVITIAVGETTPIVSTRQKANPLRVRFRDLADWWREGTMFLSSPREIASHDAYQRIINMGPQVVPLILEDLRDHGGDWYIALRQLARQLEVDPPEMSQETARSTRRIVKAWLEWGRQYGYRL